MLFWQSIDHRSGVRDWFWVRLIFIVCNNVGQADQSFDVNVLFKDVCLPIYLNSRRVKETN